MGSLALQIASIVLVPLYTRYLRPEEYGVLDVLNRVGEIVMICMMAGGVRLAAIAFYQQAKHEQERAHIAATVTVFLLAVIVIGSTAAAALSVTLTSLLGVNDPTLLVVGVVAVLFESLTVTPLALMQARVESAYFVCTMLAMFLCRVGFTIVAVVVMNWGIWGVFASSILTFAAFGTMLTVRECIKGSFRPNWAVFRKVARFALPFVPSGMFFFILFNSDRFFLLELKGAEAVGVYALGAKLAMVVTFFSTEPIFKVWGVRMFKVFELPNAADLVGRMVTRILGVYMFVGLGLFVLKDEALRLLAPPSYAQAGVVIGPLILAYFFMSAANLMDAPFYVHRRTHLKPVVVGCSAVVTLVLLTLLTPLFGTIGAAWASLGGLVFHAAATFAVARRVAYVHYEFLRIAGMMSVTVGLGLASGLLGTGFLAILEKLGLCLIWPIALWTTGLISNEDKAIMLDRGRRVAWQFRTLRTLKVWKSDL